MKLSKHFDSKEFKCRDGSEHPIDPDLIDMLENIRAYFGKPIKINSGYRSPSYNKKIGGASKSYHVKGKAADIVVKGVNASKVYAYCHHEFPKDGVGRYPRFTHVDSRGFKARWSSGGLATSVAAPKKKPATAPPVKPATTSVPETASSGKTTKDNFKFKKPSRTVKSVYCHCSASDQPHHDNLATIHKWHVIDKKWSAVGYHYVILKDGTIETGRSLSRTPAAQYGHNTGTIAICLTGLSKFSEAQFEALYTVCDQINLAYNKRMQFFGHKMVSNKACPVYDWVKVLELDRNYRMTTSNIDGKLPDPPTVITPPPTDGAAPVDWRNSPYKKIPGDLPMVRKGSKSMAVALLELATLDLGAPRTEITGVFDAELETKVKRIQETLGLKPDGIVGKNTWPAILHMSSVFETKT